MTTSLDLPNIDGLDIIALRQLIDLSEAKIVELQAIGREQLIERLSAEAEILGYRSVEALLGHRAKRGRSRRNGAKHETQ